MLAHDVSGAGPRIVLAHGFAQTRRCWAPLDEQLAVDHEVVRVDLPGHGESAELAASVETGADLLAGVGGRAVYLGYSMGGRHVLHLAARHPDLVTGLVLISATGGLLDAGERHQRRARDELLAARVLDVGVDQFLDEWLAQPLFAGLPPAARFDHARRTNTAEGLAASLRLAGTGSMEPVWDLLAGVRAPALVLAGGADPAYCAHAERLAEALGGQVDRQIVAGAGHAAHLEHPAEVTASVRAFLDRHQR